MTSWTLWLALLCAGLLTLLIRLSFILVFGKKAIPPLFHKTFRFVPVTVLSALILPDLLLPRGTMNIGLSNFRLLAGLLAIVVAWRTKNVLLTLLAGMGGLLLLQLLIK